ncbi:uncharacterized protein LOC132038391 [Lycium ferocissimum]|uniref:uncharacterized protein LOC132038391 n=1 Tax=Lycium ferocissimum TaxID=112874 RepID=UPI0028163E12|nr:uncharacterized protein LOC132038391 [Lycium ferocissimum]
MKFLPEFALCFGGATITPTVTDGATSLLLPSENKLGGIATKLQLGTSTSHTRNRRPVVKSKNGANNWKPALRVIAEERAVSDVVDGNGGGRKERAAVPSTCAKSAAKVKAKFISRSKLSPKHGEDYWKSAGPMAVPAFAPTPFLF